MVSGYFMKIAEVNLTNRETKYLDLAEKDVKRFIGGSGLGAKLLYDYTSPETDPLGPENALIFMAGPFTGTKALSSDRYEVITKSPLTGVYGEADCGGRWGETLKKCGLDGVVIVGKAKNPVFLAISDDGIEIKNASKLWGQDTFETDEQVKQEVDSKARVVCIGPAGENLVKFACIINDGRHGRAAGRCGTGAVMGSKNLKAVAVLGSKAVEVAHPKKFDEFVKAKAKYMADEIARDEVWATFAKCGTTLAVGPFHDLGDTPIKNWAQGSFEGVKNLTGEAIVEKVWRKTYRCGRCVIGCGNTVEVTEGPYKTVETAGPEYETLSMLGLNLLVDDLNAVCKGNELCNRYGLDTISTGSAIGFCMEAYERGLVGQRDTGGLDMTWGKADSMVEMIRKIAFREDLGELLGEGVVRAAEGIGGNSIEFAMHVKGLDLPAHDPRAHSGDATGYATASRGACHSQAFTHDFEDWFALPDLGYPETTDRFGVGESKAKMVVDFQHLMNLFDSLHCCKFTVFLGMSVEPLLEALNLITGWGWTKEEFLRTGERIVNLKRLYNVREGLSRKDDTLPNRILTLPRGESCGDFVPPLHSMLGDYYRIRGWDEFGIPTNETLKKLDLEEYITSGA